MAKNTNRLKKYAWVGKELMEERKDTYIKWLARKIQMIKNLD